MEFVLLKYEFKLIFNDILQFAKKKKEKQTCYYVRDTLYKMHRVNEDHHQRSLLTRQLSKDISSSTTTITVTTTTAINPATNPATISSTASIMMSKPVGPTRPLLGLLQEKQQPAETPMASNTLASGGMSTSSQQQQQQHQHQEVCGVQGATSRQLTTTPIHSCPSPPEGARQAQLSSTTSLSPSRLSSSSHCRDPGEGQPLQHQQQRPIAAPPTIVNGGDQQIRVLTPSEIMRTLPSLSQEHYDPPPPPPPTAIVHTVVVPSPPTPVHHHHHHHPNNAMVRANFCPPALLVSFFFQFLFAFFSVSDI